jgi:superfamily II DNA or RNA helicase
MYSKIILGTHLFIPEEEVTDLDALKRATTAVSRFDQEPVRMYSRAMAGWFGVPLHHYVDPRRVGRKIIDQRAPGKAIEMEFTSNYWPGQKPVLTEFQRRLEAGQTGFLFRAPPGFGKTAVCLMMLARIGLTSLVVVPRSNLIKQWKDRIREHTSLKRSEIGTAMNGRVDWKGKKIVVGLVHTLALDRFGDEFKDRFGVVVFDEVDRSVPPQTFAPVVGMFPAKYRIGVSATIQRQDGMEVVVEKHIGQCMLEGQDLNRMRPKVLIHEFDGFSGSIYGKDKLRARGQLISRLAANEKRNALIAQYVKAIVVSGRRCVVLSDRIQQLMDLKEILLAIKCVEDGDAGFYTRRLPRPRENKKAEVKYRELKKEERERTARQCKVILATYGMFGIGTDIQDLAGLVYATPMSETHQSKGRIERELSGKKQPVVVDIVDTAYDATVGWGKKRERQYNAEGLKIKKVRR